MQPTPRGSKGKGTNDPIKFLPVLPSKRAKPAWQQNPPTFLLTGRSDEDGAGPDRNGIDLVAELTASKHKTVDTRGHIYATCICCATLVYNCLLVSKLKIQNSFLVNRYIYISLNIAMLFDQYLNHLTSMLTNNVHTKVPHMARCLWK